MKKKPILKQKHISTIKSNEDEGAQEKQVIESYQKQIIGIYHNAEFASELASFIARYTTLRTVLIDADALTPIVAETLGMKNTYNTSVISTYKTKSSFNMAMDYMAKEKPMREMFKSICVKHKGLYVLSGNDHLNEYEYYSEGAFKNLVQMAGQCFDMVIINTSYNIYDSFFVDSLFLCDSIIYPIELTADNIKMVVNYVNFIHEKKGIEKDRHKIIAFNYMPSLHMDKVDVKTVTNRNFLGTVSYDRKRVKKRNQFYKQYTMSKKVKNDYKKLIKHFNINLKRGLLSRG